MAARYRRPAADKPRFTTESFNRDGYDTRLWTQVFVGMALARATAARSGNRREIRRLPAALTAHADVA